MKIKSKFRHMIEAMYYSALYLALHIFLSFICTLVHILPIIKAPFNKVRKKRSNYMENYIDQNGFDKILICAFQAAFHTYKVEMNYKVVNVNKTKFASVKNILNIENVTNVLYSSTFLRGLKFCYYNDKKLNVNNSSNTKESTIVQVLNRKNQFVYNKPHFIQICNYKESDNPFDKIYLYFPELQNGEYVLNPECFNCLSFIVKDQKTRKVGLMRFKSTYDEETDNNVIYLHSSDGPAAITSVVLDSKQNWEEQEYHYFSRGVNITEDVKRQFNEEDLEIDDNGIFTKDETTMMFKLKFED